MTHHANHVILIGQVLQTWRFGADLFARLQINRPAYYTSQDGPLDLVTVALPGAAAHGIDLSEGDELHVSGFLRNIERQVKLSDLYKRQGNSVRNLERKFSGLMEEFVATRVPQIVTEVVAVHWQKIT